MFIIVGLGNPGREYEKSRHNAGFMVLDALASEWGIRQCRRAHKALVAEYFHPDAGKIILAKPQTFMNLSGRSVRELAEYYKCPHDRLLLIYDDADLPLGDIRIRERGSAGTHNGMRSVIYELQYDDFPRIRVGIGKAKTGQDMVSHVLGSLPESELEPFMNAVEQARQAAELIALGKLGEAQARFNKKHSGRAQNGEDCGAAEET